VLLTHGQRTGEAIAEYRGELDESLCDRVRPRSIQSHLEHSATSEKGSRIHHTSDTGGV
jgi:hypothetical protein